MKFIVHRASTNPCYPMWDTDAIPAQPCASATVENVEATVHKYTPEQLQAINKSPYSNESYETKRITLPAWTITFTSLDELSEFMQREGGIVMCPPKSDSRQWDYPTLTIYDSYLE